MLLAGWEVCIGKNCDRGLENAARGRVTNTFHDAIRECLGYLFYFFCLLYRMAQTFHEAIQKFFGEKTANFSDETTEEEVKSVYDERAINYDKVIFKISSSFC